MEKKIAGRGFRKKMGLFDAYVAEAEKTLAPLPHGSYFLEIVRDLDAAQKLGKLNIE